MLQVGEILVSEDVLSENFVCDLNACKGACCVLGDSGAPLIESEKQEISAAYIHAKKYIPNEGIAAVEQQGFTVIDSDGDLGTPLVSGKHCAYTHFDKDGIAKCSFEMAYLNGETTWYKPISCHLYPIRILENKVFTAANYERWSICKPACSLGNKLKVPVYQFLKQPLIRRFSQSWYNELTSIAKVYSQQA